MKIGINVSVLKAGENISGIGYYTYRIVKELLDNDTENEYYLFSNCEISVHFPEKAAISRENCYHCKYACPSRIGDITLGDFWGVEKNQPDCLRENGGIFDEKKGISFCLVKRWQKEKHHFV